MTDRKDDYGVLGSDMEVDSDVNEDLNREAQLDDSFDAWLYENINEQVKRKYELTNVPGENVFDTAVSLDENAT